MSELEVLARQVIANWSDGNLARAIRNLHVELGRLDRERALHKKAIADLKDAFSEDPDFEIDGCPLVASGSGGVFIGVWYWVADDTA